MSHTRHSSVTFRQKTATFLASFIAVIGLIAAPGWAIDVNARSQVSTQQGVGNPSDNSGDNSAVEQERIRLLGTDAAIGNRFRPAEAQTALRIEKQRKVTLRRVTLEDKSNADWFDEQGNSYDAVGNFPKKYFKEQWPNLKRQIDRHRSKADYVPVDISQFDETQQAKVKKFINKHPEFDARVFTVGDAEAKKAS